MPKESILVTGSNGEIGHGLISTLSQDNNIDLIALDLQPLDDSLRKKCSKSVQMDVLDEPALEDLFQQFQFTTVYHLASILSTKAEYSPERAQRVNVDGTVNLLRLATEQSNHAGKPVKFIYPSSIAVYGLPNLEAKQVAGRISEEEWLEPATMYGCNKLACENLGCYYSEHYRRLDENAAGKIRIDFRGLRFPGLISAMTVPTGGTSDYGPEMLHNAAQGLPYACFVRPDTRLPFMVMPDAIKSLLQLAAAPRERLTRKVYNVTSFSPTAGEIYDIAQRAFPQADVTFTPHPARQEIVDGWPADIDDSAARQDWDWRPEYDQKKAFEDYLIPAIQKRYAHVGING